MAAKRNGTNGHYPLVKIAWMDANSISQWKEETELENRLCPCVSVGFVIKESKTCVTLAATMSEGMFNDIQVIPKKLIQKRAVIRVAS